MPDITIKRAETDQDIAAARALCREWLDWHWRNYPADWPIEGNPMNAERFDAIVEDLPSIHARPKGAILIASVYDQPAGCVMYNEAAPGVAEFNRMFVSETGRGHGLGRLMLDEMFGLMNSDGYERVMFSSARFLTHARAMYLAAGFEDMAHPDGFPDEWRDYVYFMRRSLVG